MKSIPVTVTADVASLSADAAAVVVVAVVAVSLLRRLFTPPRTTAAATATAVVVAVVAVVAVPRQLALRNVQSLAMYREGNDGRKE
jgi:hypothetical protein